MVAGPNTPLIEQRPSRALVRPLALCFFDVGGTQSCGRSRRIDFEISGSELVENGTWHGVTPIAPAAEPSRAMAPQKVQYCTRPSGAAKTG